jgi:hypothetical protein
LNKQEQFVAKEEHFIAQTGMVCCKTRTLYWNIWIHYSINNPGSLKNKRSLLHKQVLFVAFLEHIMQQSIVVCCIKRTICRNNWIHFSINNPGLLKKTNCFLHNQLLFVAFLEHIMQQSTMIFQYIDPIMKFLPQKKGYLTGNLLHNIRVK